MEQGQGIFPLKGVVQHYNWGGFSFIPQLVGTPNEGQKPVAEYWLGAHPNHPALVQLDGREMPLNQLIDQQPAWVLGAQVQQTFGRLPYLLKVLDVRQMLSIQVHPNKAAAAAGFEAENRAGVPLSASNRNYKDDNHKPELMVALSDFWLLHGFKPEGKLREVLESVPELSFLLELFNGAGYEGMYQRVMTMPQEEVNAILQPVVDRILPLYRNGELLKQAEDFWAARAAETYCKDGNIDRGIFSIFLFNLVYLRRGEGVFQGAQMPHAYLEGQNVELMANSDNVLRAGLTDKHIDVPELLKHVRFEATVPKILGVAEGREEVVQFQVPAPEFELYQYLLGQHPLGLKAASADILLVLDGEVTVHAGATRIPMKRGSAILATAGTVYRLESATGAEVYRAAVPQNAPAE